MNREEIIKRIVELREAYEGYADCYRATGHDVELHFSLGVTNDLSALLLEVSV